MDLQEIRTETGDLEGDERKSMHNVSGKMPYIEERMSVNEITLCDGSDNIDYRLGIINIYGNKAGFINDAYINKKYIPDANYTIGDTILFDSSKVCYIPENIRFQTLKNVYLVRYVLGGVMMNKKTGEEQQTINYDFPIEVIKVFPKKETVYLSIKENEIVSKMIRMEGIVNGVLTAETSSLLVLDDKTRVSIQIELAKSMPDSHVFFASLLPDVLRKVGIDNYKKYAYTIEQFVELYLTPQFCFQKNIEINGKKHPGVIILLNGKSIDEALISLKGNYSKANTQSPIKKTKMNNDLLTQIIKTLIESADEKGVVLGTAIPGIFNNIGVGDYRQFATSIEEFTKKYLGKVFTYKKNFVVDGKYHDGVIVLKKKEKKLTKINNHILLDNTIFNEFKDDIDEVRYGIINVCSKKNGFINREYVDKKEYPDYVLDDSNSIIFATDKVKWEPEGVQLKTVKNIYLVAYRINGTIVNTKTNIEQPALDYNYPVKVLRSFSRKEYVCIAVESDRVVVEQYDYVDAGTDVIPTGLSIEEILISMREYLYASFQEKQFLQASLFPNIAKKVGLSDFRSYADSVEEFINTYLPEFELKKNIVIDGTKYPGIIYIRGKEPVINSTAGIDFSIDNSFDILDNLYEKGEYYEFLSSEIMEQINMCDLPLHLVEKALISAAQLLYLGENVNIELNTLQKELIGCQTPGDFIKKWKKNSVFDEHIMEQCALSSIVLTNYPKNKGIIFEFLNSVGYSTTRNDNYPGLTKRFSFCNDYILPYLFVIRACVQKKQGAVERCIAEYTQVIKNLQHAQYYHLIDEKNRMYSFTEFLRVIDKYVMNISDLTRILRTSIMSVFVDVGEMDTLKAVIPLISKEAMSVDVRLIDLYFGFDKCTEQDIIDLLDANVNLQLLQKIIALVWERYSEEQEIPEKLLKVLCWICLNDASTSVDEIIRFHLVKSPFTKLQKSIQLLKSYKKVCLLAQSDVSMHVIASYIRFIACEHNNTEKLNEVCREIEGSWAEYAEKVIQKIFSDFSCLDFSNENDYLKLFRVFRLDVQNQLKLQNYYADWFSQVREARQFTKEEEVEILEQLFTNRAYEAFTDLFLIMQSRDVAYEISETRVRQYVSALMELQRYGETISYLQQNSVITKDIREELLIRVMTENFRNNGLTTRAFAIFSEEFSENDAIDLLMRSIRPNQYNIITCLIALYCNKKDYIRSIYLYQIFQSKSENGFTRLYTQIRRCIKNSNGGLKNHYDVIELAFYTLCVDDLLDFLTWARLIQISAIKGYNAIHPFAFTYEKIMENPEDAKKWSVFLSHMLKRVDINAWVVVVCETILETKMDYAPDVNMGETIRRVMNVTESNELPHNLLPYVCTYIMRNNDSLICRELVHLLNNKRVADYLLKENIWNQKFLSVENEFKVFCIEKYNETGNEVFYNATTALRMTFDVSELAILAQTSGDKSYLYKQICNNYLSSNNTAETISLLNNTEWSNMSARDNTVLSLLRLLYREDEYLLVNKLFTDEEMVHRFKYDCAKIISAYPDKSELIIFDENCIDLKHKLIVYAYVLASLYDEDIYHRYTFTFKEIQDKHVYYAYLKYISTVFYAQLEWNQSYPFFYKKWRYLKLYLAEILSSGNKGSDQLILDTMEQKGHFSAIYSDTYEPFTENVKEFWNLETIQETDKRYFLYTLMSGNVGDFIKDRSSVLLNSYPSEKEIMKKLVAELDYREVNWNFYRLYLEDIKSYKYDEATKIASALSEYTVDSLMMLKQQKNLEEAVSLFSRIALQEKPADVAKMIFHLEEELFTKYSDFLIPLLCSRQFIFWIFGGIRIAIVQNKKYSYPVHIVKVTDYLSKYNSSEALAVKGYLMTLRACMDNDRSLAAQLLYTTDIFTDIPAQWKKEAENIQNYVNGKNDKFNPDRGIVDSSYEDERREIKFLFIERLKKRFDIKKQRMDIGVAVALYEQYIDLKTDLVERVRSVVDLIVNYPRLDKEKQKDLRLPTQNSLILMAGLDVVVPEFNLSIDEKISILADLFNGRKLFRGEKENIKLLNDYLGQRLKNNISLDSWIRHANVIKEYLEENHMLMDFGELQDRILSKCRELLRVEVSYEDRYQGMLKVLQQSEGLESIYSRNVFDSIRRLCRKIEDGVRLKIDVVNVDNTMSDGNVYFQIQNIGKYTVSFLGEEYYVVFKQEGHPEIKITINSIRDLQSGFITGGKTKVILNDSESEINIGLSIYKRRTDGNAELICSVCTKMIIGEETDGLSVHRRNRYEVGSAVTDSEMLFGRNEVQKALQDMIPAGVTVIYGPSRIGKTSLMNWIKNTLAVEKGNVMSITFGGEGGMGKESDYQENFVEPNLHNPVPYDDDEKMTEYLMVSTIVQSLTSMRRRVKEPSKKPLEDEFIQQIVRILKDDSLSISDRYYWLNNVLTSEGIELWLLLDEFQQVVECWKPKISCEFVRLCKMLLYDRENSNIKLVICGSDDLLRHMVLEDESVWRQTFPTHSRIAVEPLAKNAFCDMIMKDKKIIGTNLVYSKSALESLFSYTGGVALYGKEICNAILDEIESLPEKYVNRNIIYASDVADAAQRLLNRQASELDTKAKEGIREIYDAVTKNLKFDSDMQYLWFIAKWLYTNTDKDSFSEYIFTRNEALRDEKELHDSLEIAVARGILDCKESQKDGDVKYVFRTIFYYFAFLGSARNNLDESKIFLSDNGDLQGGIGRSNALTMIEQFGELSDGDQMTVLSSVYHQKLNPAARENFRKSIGDQHYGDIVGGSKIGTQSNIQVNVQSITNTLNGILAAGADTSKVLLELNNLPRLNSYLPQLDEEKSNEVISDERLSLAMDSYVADMEEGLEASCTSENVSEVAKIELWDILRMEKDEFRRFMREYKVPEFFMNSLRFAYQLDSLFEKGAMDVEAENIDYSPVTIMYCKLIEGMLKEYHVKTYSECFSGVKTNLKRYTNRKYTWGEVIGLPQQQKQRLTIGSFTAPLDSEKDAIEILAEGTYQEAELWEKHKKAVKVVKDIRNLSAHGNKDQRISLVQKERITKLILDEGGFVRLIKLAN